MAVPAASSRRRRVVIIGGGLAGLSAADSLLSPTTARPRADGAAPTPLPGGSVPEVVVLEASARLGGRTASTRLASVPAVVDIGGQWLGSRQAAALQVAREFGITLHEQYHRGRRVLNIASTLATYAGLIPNVSIGALLDAQLALIYLQVIQLFMSCCCGSRNSWLHRWADSTTMATWSAQYVWTTTAAALIRIIIQAFTGQEPEQLSVLAFARYVGSNHGVEEMSEIGPGSVQAWTMVGGAQQLSISLGRRILAAGGTIRFNAAVNAIHRLASPATSERAVRITCADGFTTDADVVLVAIPPPLHSAITFSPPLSAARHALTTQSQMGGIIKALVVYRRAWWRAKGYSGEVICDTRTAGGPAFNIFDASPPLLSPAVADAWRAPAGTAGATAPAAAASIATPGTPSATFLAPAPTPPPAVTGGDDAVGAGTGAGAGAVPAPTAGYGSSDVTADPGTGIVAIRGTGATGRTIATMAGPMPAYDGDCVPALVAFINAAAAREWSSRPPEERRAAVLAQFRRWFDDEAALSPVEYVEQDWLQYPHTRGCPIATYGQGVLQAFGLHHHLAKPEWPTAAGDGAADPFDGGPICLLHYAGTETASTGTGYMDGAIRSGWTAAARLAAACAHAGQALPPRAATAAPAPQAVDASALPLLADA